MDVDTIKKCLQSNTFRYNNGQILLALNIMDPKECTVGNIAYLRRSEAKEIVQSCLNYLADAGYIRITGPKGETFSGVLEEGNRNFRIAITHTGFELLMGIKDNPAVEV